MKKLFFSFLVVAGIFSLAFNFLAGADVVSADRGRESHKVNICHKNDGNGWTLNNVDDDSIDGSGSGDHNRSGHQDGKDIIPPFYDDNRAGNWNPRNWDATGQAIFNNGCSDKFWKLNISENTPSCGVNKVTISGTAEYGGDSSTTLLVKVNGNTVIDSESENVNWSKEINVVPGQTYTVNAYIYDKSDPDLSGSHQDSPKVSDSWTFTVDLCPEPTPTDVPEPTPTDEPEVTPTPTDEPEVTPTPTDEPEQEVAPTPTEEPQAGKTSSLGYDISCNQGDFKATFDLKDNGVAAANILVNFTYNGIAKQATTNADGRASVTFPQQGSYDLKAAPDNGYPTQSMKVNMPENCPAGNPDPATTPGVGGLVLGATTATNYSNGQVLGVSTMANTGVAEDLMALSSMASGILLLGHAYKKKN